jgi:hypothetical protein
MAASTKALTRGLLDVERARELQVRGRPAVFAVDTSSWPRCDAETSPERGFYHHPSRHSAGKPIVAGWNYSWIAQLNWSRDSWTAPVDITRIPPQEDTGQATADQVRNLVNRLRPAAGDPVPLFVFDAGYDPIALTVDLAEVRAQIAVRIRDDRVFYADPPPREPGTKGRPPRHGLAFRLADPTTWPAPDATHVAEDPRYGRIQITAWHGLHPKLARRGRWADTTRTPIVTGTVIRIEVEHLPKPTGRAKKTLWLWWAGPTGTTPTSTCAGAPTSTASISNTPCASPRTPSAGPPRRSAHRNRPTAGAGSSWPATPSYGSRADSSPTSDSPGNDHETQPSSRPPGCDGDFAG